MTNTVDFLAFAIGGSANVESQTAWVSDSVVTNGFQSGITLSAQMNKAIRQASVMAAAKANWVSDVINASVLDNGSVSTLVEQLWLASIQSRYFVDSGSANTIVIATPSGLSFGAPAAGLAITVKMAATNTGATTLNWMGNGAVAVKTQAIAALSASTLLSGGVYNFCFDGTQWQFIA